MSDNISGNNSVLSGNVIEPIEEVVLEGLPKEHRASAQKAVLRYLQIVQESYTSPIPPPSVIAQYGEIQPDFPDRLLKMAESQHRHRIGIEASVVAANIINERLGLGAAFILATIFAVGSIHLIDIGNEFKRELRQ